MENIEQELKDHLQHSYLKKCLPNPVVDKNKLILLYRLIERTNHQDIYKKNYILTTMLVQIALDTHDLVSENIEEETDDVKKHRQLTVLAGDYYSGLYYYLLAQLNDIAMIHTLASAIKEINELKMCIYYEKQQTLPALLSEIKKNESILIIRVAEQLDCSLNHEFAENWLMASKLTNDKCQFLLKRNTLLIDLLATGSVEGVSSKQVLQTIDTAFHYYWKNANALINKLPDSYRLLIVELEDYSGWDPNANKVNDL